MSSRLPAVLVIDDQPDSQRSLEALLSTKADVTVLHPEELQDTDLVTADLVLVDYELTEWPERELGHLSLRAYDGLALLASLRRAAHCLSVDDPEHSPTAFAIFSGKLTDLSGPLPPSKVPHEIARIYNLEWAFEKGRSSLDPSAPPNEEQFVVLANAVRALPDEWAAQVSEASERQAAGLLGLSDSTSVDGTASPTFGSDDWRADWRSQAWEDVLDAYPPIFELFERTHGLAFLRWLLHRIFPYPTFLWDTRYLCARLGIESADGALGPAGEAIRDLFRPYEYRGLIAGFAGTRWWRTGIENALWEITEGESADPQAIRSALAQRGVRISAPDAVRPVVSINPDDLRPEGLVSADRAVRVRPDDWPPFADSAWMALDALDGRPDLRPLVAPDDRYRLITP